METAEAPPPEASPEGTEAAAGSAQDDEAPPPIDSATGLPPKIVGEGCASPPEASPEGTEAAASSAQDDEAPPPIDSATGLPPKFVGCTLIEGCALAAWHPGVCSVWLCSRRERKTVAQYEAAAAPPPRDLAKRAREQGLLGPLKLANRVKQGATSEAQPHVKNGKKRKAEPVEASEEANGEAEAPSKPKRKREPLVYDGKRTGARSGTRSHGEPVWALDEPVIESTEPPVSAALDVGSDGRIGLRLAVRSQALAKPTLNKGVAALRDYLGRGKSDPFANDSCSSVAQEQLAVKRGERDVRWGCVCRGQVAKGGVELVCRRCSLTFHTKCERLDYSAAELRRIVQLDAYLCTDCERLQRIDEGYDPAVGRFTWQCKHCTRIFEESEYHAAEKHGARCAAQLSKRAWSCPCHGQLGSTKLMATECKECNRWFHHSCKTQLRNSWNVAPKKRLLRDTCAACEGTWAKGGSADGEKKEKEKPIAARTVKSAILGSELSALTAVCEHDVPGTLKDGRVHVRESTLGPHSGYGLFAGVPIRRNEVITAYYGTPLYREQLEPDHDTSCALPPTPTPTPTPKRARPQPRLDLARELRATFPKAAAELSRASAARRHTSSAQLWRRARQRQVVRRCDTSQPGQPCGRRAVLSG